MTRGIGNVEYSRQGSEVAVQGVPNWGFLYQPSTVKDTKFNLGDRFVTPDGRVFRYSLAGTGGVQSEFGAINPFAVNISAVAPAQVAPASPVILGLPLSSGNTGDYSVTVTVGASAGPNGNGTLTQDQLRGGYIVVGDGSNQHPQFRGIIGNDALATAGGSVNVYLDGPLTSGVVVGTTYIEVTPNVFGGVTSANVANNAYASVIGIPAVTATVGQYFWLQTWGPVWITSDGNTNKVANGRDLFFVTNGSLVGQQATAEPLQRAGYAMDANTGAVASSPTCMLQLGV